MGDVPSEHQYDAADGHAQRRACHGTGGDAGHELTPIPPSSTRKLIGLLLAALLGIGLLTTLGIWQLQRLAWKEALIATVAERTQAAPVAAPGPAAWTGLTAAHDAYRHVTAQGVFLNGQETLVQVATGQGSGYWVMTPLRTDAGFIVLINRGFVPTSARNPASRAAGQIAGEAMITGLLRLTEPHGGLLRANRPDENRWYSRDVAAIAGADRLPDAAPYFIDADATPNPGGLPIGGLTVIHFPNNHLAYAGTWFGLALLLAGTVAIVIRDELRSRR